MKYWFLFLIGFSVFVFFFLRWLTPFFIYHPSKDMQASPADLGLDYENVRLQTADGETIAGWFIPAIENSSTEKGNTLLFFHGNAGNISHRLASIAFFHKLNLSVLIIDYRGFGESTGKPSVAGTLADARAAWQWLVDEKRTSPTQIILFGRSLGGGVAANFAGTLKADEMPRALILESTFTSLHAVGKKWYPGLPRWVFAKEYETLKTLEHLSIPLLVVHSPDDEVIDFALGREIFESYKGPKQFLEITGTHNGGWFESMAVYEKGIRAFVGELGE